MKTPFHRLCMEVARSRWAPDKAIAELTQRFGNPTLISKSLINTFLEIPAVQDENTSSLTLFVDNLHNIVRTLKTYGHEADLRAAANMQQIISKLPPKIAVRWSRRKLELQAKEVDLKDLDEWLEREVQVQEMAFGCASTKEERKRETQVKFKQIQVGQEKEGCAE